MSHEPGMRANTESGISYDDLLEDEGDDHGNVKTRSTKEPSLTKGGKPGQRKKILYAKKEGNLPEQGGGKQGARHTPGARRARADVPPLKEEKRVGFLSPPRIPMRRSEPMPAQSPLMKNSLKMIPSSRSSGTMNHEKQVSQPLREDYGMMTPLGKDDPARVLCMNHTTSSSTTVTPSPFPMPVASSAGLGSGTGRRPHPPHLRHRMERNRGSFPPSPGSSQRR